MSRQKPPARGLFQENNNVWISNNHKEQLLYFLWVIAEKNIVQMRLFIYVLTSFEWQLTSLTH